MKELSLGNKKVGLNHRPYFIADIAANHDGELTRAKDLVWIAKEAGADCAKFQHFLAQKIVNDVEFKKIEDVKTHQSEWKKSVSQIYDQYHFRREWTEEIYEECIKADIEFSTSPYDYDAVKEVNQFVNFFKIGSGDISWIDFLEFLKSQNKPLILATGASSLSDVERAVGALDPSKLILMQCNTNYTVDQDKHGYVNLNVLKLYREKFPSLILGLSDHTLGHGSVLGSIALGSRVIEKHFTDDNDREGPDHKFALNPLAWKQMVEMGNEVYETLGDGQKRIEPNEENAFIVQRRSIVCNKDLKKGHTITADDLEFLRPCPVNSFHPYEKHLIIGKDVLNDKKRNESILKSDVC
ncbi:N-acetylneuraminate synthase family protein [Gammaproteobacteria bacterium]|jgi:sialic acid synthase SpsE|nr:N-acetylneuraminate synthase family protein [Gammaproteobacteria bacterium]